MKKAIIASFLIASVIFLLLPSSSEELYKCPPGGNVCIDLYSSQSEQSSGVTIYKLLSGDYEADSQTKTELARNSLVYVPTIVLVAVYLFRGKKH